MEYTLHEFQFLIRNDYQRDAPLYTYNIFIAIHVAYHLNFAVPKFKPLWFRINQLGLRSCTLVELTYKKHKIRHEKIKEKRDAFLIWWIFGIPSDIDIFWADIVLHFITSTSFSQGFLHPFLAFAFSSSIRNKCQKSSQIYALNNISLNFWQPFWCTV